MIHDDILAKSSPEREIFHFTDGAVEGELGAWACITENETALSGPALGGKGEVCSTFAEMMAVSAILEKIQEEKWERGTKHTIWTDSAQTAKLIRGANEWKKDGEGKELVKQIRELLDRAEEDHWIQLKWCKSHVGIPGNELADKAAGLQLKRIKEEVEKMKLETNRKAGSSTIKQTKRQRKRARKKR